MKNKLILFLIIFLLTALAVSTYAISQDKDYSLSVKRGWNLVYGDISTYSAFDSESRGFLGDKNVVAKYRYVNPINTNFLEYSKEEVDKSQKQYRSYSELNAEELTIIKNSCGEKCDEYFEDDASWVYFDQPGKILFRFTDPKTIIVESGEKLGIRLFKGWNTKTFMPKMFAMGNGEYASISDFKGDCIIEDVEIYDGEKEKWENATEKSFSDSDILSGLAIKVGNNCEFAAK